MYLSVVWLCLLPLSLTFPFCASSMSRLPVTCSFLSAVKGQRWYTVPQVYFENWPDSLSHPGSDFLSDSICSLKLDTAKIDSPLGITESHFWDTSEMCCIIPGGTQIIRLVWDELCISWKRGESRQWLQGVVTKICSQVEKLTEIKMEHVSKHQNKAMISRIPVLPSCTVEEPESVQ